VRLLFVARLLGIFLVGWPAGGSFVGSRGGFASQWFVGEGRARHAVPLQGLAAAKFIHEFQKEDTDAGQKSTPVQPETFGIPGVSRSADHPTRGVGQSEHSQKAAPPDISRSGRDFLEVCSNVGSEGAAGSKGGASGKGGAGSEVGIDSEGNRDVARDNPNAPAERNAPAWRDGVCLGWVGGFTEGFLVHDELLGVPRRDRLACLPRGVTSIQIVRVMKKYLADNPEKAKRATRYIASLALAGAFPCRAGR